MKKIVTLLVICTLLIISCKKEQKVKTKLEYLTELKNDILYKGDTNSFEVFFIERFLDSDVSAGIELLPYAIIMSNKMNYDQASYAVFYAYSCIYTGNRIDSIDEVIAKMAIEYLEKVAKTGYTNDLNKLPKNSNKMTYKEKFIYINSNW